MNGLEFIAFLLIFAGSLYFAWRDGFEQGVSAGNRRHVRQWSRLFRENRRLSERVAGLDNRIDGIEARLDKAEKLLKFTSNCLYGRENVEKMAKEAGTTLYANNEPYDTVPEDDICENCSRKGTSACYGCGYDHELYQQAERPDDWSCDTCVNDGDMSHTVCKHCNNGTCYVKKEEPLKFDHEPSGEIIGRVVETEDTGDGMRFKISPYDEYTASDADPSDVLNDSVKPSEEVEVKED